MSVIAEGPQAVAERGVGAPERTLAQRQDALKRANDIRSRRARIKRDLKVGRVKVQGLLASPREYVLTAKVSDLLMSVPKVGKVKVTRILNQCRVSANKTVGGLSERQRRELVTALRNR